MPRKHVLGAGNENIPVTLHRCKSNEDNNPCASGHQPITGCLELGRNVSFGCVILKLFIVELHTLLSEASATGHCRKRITNLIDYLEGPDLATHALFCEVCNDTCFMWFGRCCDGALCAHFSVMPAPLKLLSYMQAIV